MEMIIVAGIAIQAVSNHFIDLSNYQFPEPEPIVIEEIVPKPKPTNDGIVDYIKKTFPKESKIMLKIAKCESGLKQFDEEGEVITNPFSRDYGIYQINYRWLPKAKALGFDVMTIEGNVKMAKWLYNNGGLNHWSASFYNCWRFL